MNSKGVGFYSRMGLYSSGYNIHFPLLIKGAHKHNLALALLSFA